MANILSRGRWITINPCKRSEEPDRVNGLELNDVKPIGFLLITQAIPLKWICRLLPELLASMPAAGFSSPTNVDFLKYRHIQMSPHLSRYIHTQSHNSLVKKCIYDNQKSFKHSEFRAKLSLNLYKELQNAASHGTREMEVPPLLTRMSVSTSTPTGLVTMVSVKHSVLCFRILYHVGQRALCDVIMVTKTGS